MATPLDDGSDQHSRRSTSKYKTCNFLLPVGGAMTMIEYCHVDVFRPVLLSNRSLRADLTMYSLTMATLFDKNSQLAQLSTSWRSLDFTTQIWNWCDELSRRGLLNYRACKWPKMTTKSKMADFQLSLGLGFKMLFCTSGDDSCAYKVPAIQVKLSGWFSSVGDAVEPPWDILCWEPYQIAIFATSDMCAKFCEFLSISSPSKMHFKCSFQRL